MNSSRRNFLASGLALPVVASATRSEQAPQSPRNRRAPPRRCPPARNCATRVLGKTGLKVTTVGFGCMITSDGSVVERAADHRASPISTPRAITRAATTSAWWARRSRGKRKDLMLSSKTEGRDQRGALAQLDTSLKELGTDHLDIWYLHAKTKPDRCHRRPDRSAADRQEGRQDPLRRRQHAQRAARADPRSWPRIRTST